MGLFKQKGKTTELKSEVKKELECYHYRLTVQPLFKETEQLLIFEGGKDNIYQIRRAFWEDAQGVEILRFNESKGDFSWIFFEAAEIVEVERVVGHRVKFHKECDGEFQGTAHFYERDIKVAASLKNFSQLSPERSFEDKQPKSQLLEKPKLVIHDWDFFNKEASPKLKKKIQAKEKAQTKIDEILTFNLQLRSLRLHLPSNPDQFEKNIFYGARINLELAHDYSLDVIDDLQLFVDEPLKKSISEKKEEVLGSIYNNIKEISPHLYVFDSLYAPKKQYTLDKIIQNLDNVLCFMKRAEKKYLIDNFGLTHDSRMMKKFGGLKFEKS